jgi:hypothetical protein
MSNILSLYKPRPDFLSVTENVFTMDGGKRRLEYSGIVDKHICNLCYMPDDVVKCSKCVQYVCEACSLWKYESDDKIHVIEVCCPTCDTIMYHDFY